MGSEGHGHESDSSVRSCASAGRGHFSRGQSAPWGFGSGAHFFLGPTIIVFGPLLAESLVVAFLLRGRGFRFLRTCSAWFFITLVTYIAMALAYLITTGWGFLATETRSLAAWIALAILEALVVLIEAWIILLLSRARYFRTTEAQLSRKAAFGVSLIGNTASLGVGLLPLLLPQIWRI